MRRLILAAALLLGACAAALDVPPGSAGVVSQRTVIPGVMSVESLTVIVGCEAMANVVADGVSEPVRLAEVAGGSCGGTYAVQ